MISCSGNHDLWINKKYGIMPKKMNKLKLNLSIILT